MKKLFLLIPALVLSLMANAATINITPGGSLDLRHAVSSANAGDTIVLADGEYTQGGDYTVFNKNLVVMAANNAAPVVKFTVPARILGGPRVKISGIKFDMEHLHSQSWYSHLISVEDYETYEEGGKQKTRGIKVDGNRLILENCEFYNDTLNNSVIFCSSDRKIDSLIINNCIFHDIMKSCIFLENTDAKGLIVKNSTFYDISTNNESYYAGVIDSRSTSAEVNIDHCTFYNCQVMNTDYATIGKIGSSGSIVSNCIFSMPTSTDNLRAIRDVSKANNCLTYNYTKDSNWGIHSGVTKTNCINGQDPLFNDAANDDFHLASTSPAVMASDNWTTLGAKKWWPTLTYPSTDFSSPFTLTGSAAKLVGNIRLNASNHIEYYDNSVCGSAAWRIHSTKACAIYATVNMESGSASGHILKMIIFDADGNRIDSVSSSYKNDDVDFGIPGCMYIPAAGDYVVALYNTQSHSSAKIENITLAYAGGAVQNMPDETDIDEAWFSSNGTRADGKISYSSISSGCWAKWNIAVASAGTYNVTVNISGQYGHKYVVEFLKEGESTPIVVTKGETNYGNDATLYANDLGSVALEAANYEMKVFNDVGDAALHSVTLAYSGGAVVNIPNNNIPLTEAILSDGATRDNDGLHFRNNQYVEWNIHADAGVYTFTATCTSTSDYSNLKFTIKQGESEIYSYKPQYDYKATDKTISSPGWLLDEGDYVLQLFNPTSGSGYVTALSATADETIFIIDENETDPNVIKDMDKIGKKALLKRSFTANMYNTLCIPVEPGSSELTSIFGEGYVLLELNTATLAGDVLELNFTTPASFLAGKPYLVKPTQDVTNPIFNSHTIHNYTYNNTKSCTGVDFIGSFVKNTIVASEYNLFLGSGDMLYFSNNDVTIKGLRAYFRVKDNGSGAPVRKARIVEQGNVVTELELIDGEWQDIKSANGIIKTIENGQLILIRDGKRYNVMGIRF